MTSDSDPSQPTGAFMSATRNTRIAIHDCSSGRATQAAIVRNTGFGREVRCGCNRLHFRVVAERLEIKCDRCHEVTVIDRPSLWPDDPSRN